MPAEPSERRGALIWLLVALALRLFGLGRWSLWGDEAYSIDSAEAFGGADMHVGERIFPVFFALEHAALAVGRWLLGEAGLRAHLEFVARVVPVLAGTLASVAAFTAPRGLLDRRERHLLAALMTFSPWLLYFAQTARFYAPLFAFTTIAAFELVRAEQERSLARSLRGTAWLAAALLTNPTALFVLGGHLFATFLLALFRWRPVSRASFPPLALFLLVALAVVLFPELIDATIFYKLGVRDAGVESLPALLAGIGYNVGPAIVVLALAGLPALFARSRALAIHVLAAVVPPSALMLVLAACGRSVEQRYLLAVVPLALVPAAVAIAELARALAVRMPRATLVVPSAALLPWLPALVSQYVDGNRHDLRGAAEVVCARLEPGDGIIAETHALLRRYLPADFPDEHLIEAPPEARNFDQYRAMWRDCPRMWVIVPDFFDDFGGNSKAFQQWAWTEGLLVRELYTPRFDYHQNRLRVFLVDPQKTRAWWPR